MKTFMWPTVLTTWAEEKRTRPYIISFEAKEIDVNLKKFLSQKEWRLGLWVRQFGLMLASPDVLLMEARGILQNFETSLSRCFSQTPLKKHALFPKQTLEKDITVESGFLLTISYFKHFLTRVNINISVKKLTMRNHCLVWASCWYS